MRSRLFSSYFLSFLFSGWVGGGGGEREALPPDFLLGGLFPRASMEPGQGSSSGSMYVGTVGSM